ncbi:MAG: hypothetical protein FKY71_16850 [Spiribacter salinus]|uniref:Uncharacterized protein n=1 Tax=Spiribacter salinus TaxID=1335746 RepID=A0A540VH18_9GAMM|nr:MAG: hypothetical protein FKY71_16850 [Spiribacter salinus]
MAGRPAHEPTDQQRRQVEAMAGYGIPHLDMAAVIGIDRKTLEKHYRRELDTGSTKATAKIAESLYRQAVEGNTSAAIFWMKARAGWSEKTRHELSGPDGGPMQAVVILPAKNDEG